MIVVPFLPIHLSDFQPQEIQSWLTPWLKDAEYQQALSDHGPGYSGLADGVVIACAGIIPFSNTRALAWALLSENAVPRMAAITRAIGQFLDRQPYERIETAIKTDFAAGHRWARMLGFEREGTMRKWESGQDSDLYARIK